MTTYNFSHKRGDTLDTLQFRLSLSTPVNTLADLPATGELGVIYVVLSTGVYYLWTGTAYIVTTTRVPIDLTGASLHCQFRKQPLLAPVLDLSDGNGLTIVDAVNGILAIDEQIIELPAFPYYYDIEITFTDGTVKTYIEGICTIVEDTTRG